MKILTKHSFDANNCRREWNELVQLLAQNQTLSEKKHILPFFKQRRALSIFISEFFPKIKKPDFFAHEYEIYRDFIADLVIGDSTTHHYLLVEFEDGKPGSIFVKKGNKSTPDWSPRIEAAFSQLVDWLWKLEDMRSTADFQNTFGSRSATFEGLIIIGKDMNLAPQEIDRLKWRMDRTRIDSKGISCLSFNQLSEELNFYLTTRYNV
ncbi:MAG: Shedu immune nuclease family protein [Snowella sp.]